MLYANGKAAPATPVQCCWYCRAWIPRARAVSSNTLSVRATRMGIHYTSFGVPTEEERAHHYLWRIRKALPPAGHSGFSTDPTTRTCW